MEDKQNIDFLNNPDQYLAIANTEQLMDEFGDMFEKTYLYRAPIFLEKNMYKKELPKERFFATESSLVILRGDNIWNMDINDQNFLEQVHKNLIFIKIAVEGGSTIFNRDITVDNKPINVTYKPYTLETSEYIIQELNKRKELLQKKD